MCNDGWQPLEEGVKEMETHNFKLNSVFHDNAKEYITKSVML